MEIKNGKRLANWMKGKAEVTGRKFGSVSEKLKLEAQKGWEKYQAKRAEEEQEAKELRRMQKEAYVKAYGSQLGKYEKRDMMKKIQEDIYKEKTSALDKLRGGGYGFQPRKTSGFGESQMPRTQAFDPIGIDFFNPRVVSAQKPQKMLHVGHMIPDPIGSLDDVFGSSKRRKR